MKARRAVSDLRLHEGESAFSNAIRGARFWGDQSVEASARSLFEGMKPPFSSGLIIPYGRTSFANAMCEKSTADYLYQSTDLPILYNLSGNPFNSSDERGEAETNVFWNFLFNLSLPVNVVGACSDCCSEQMGSRGYSWWLRDHAISGILVCVKHGLTLSRFNFLDVMKGLGALPSEVLTGEGRIADRNNYASKFAESVHQSIGWTTRRDPTSLISSFRNQFDFAYGKQKDHAAQEFANFCIAAFSKEDVALVMGNLDDLDRSLQSAYHGYSCSWKTLLHIQLVFLKTRTGISLAAC